MFPRGWDVVDPLASLGASQLRSLNLAHNPVDVSPVIRQFGATLTRLDVSGWRANRLEWDSGSSSTMPCLNMELLRATNNHGTNKRPSNGWVVKHPT